MDISIIYHTTLALSNVILSKFMIDQILPIIRLFNIYLINYMI